MALSDEELAAVMAYEQFVEEALAEPIKYVKHDTRAHDDDALYKLVVTFGMAHYGWYWLLVELLTGRKNHYYDVSDEIGWRQLSRDMSCMCDFTVDDCKEFIAELYSAELISREQYDELHRITITRILKDGRAYAEKVASKKLGAWKTNRKRMLS